MNKQQQIEEMAVIGCVRTPQAHTAEECGKCDFKNGQCNAYRHAEALYNAGYRKLPEESVVLSREEYEVLKIKEKEKHWLETCMSVWENAKIASSKKTAEKDFNAIIRALEERKERVKAFYGLNESVGVDIAIRTVKELAKQYGVEIKE